MIPEWERPDDANEDDEFFADAMEAAMNQALEAELDLTRDEEVACLLVLLGRCAVELGAIRQLLDARLNRRDDRPPWQG